MTDKKRGRAGLALLLAAMLLLSGCAGILAPAGTAAAPAAESAAATDGAVPSPTSAAAQAQSPEASAERVDYANAVTVSTVDELLAAIAPETRILLEPGLYDLSTAGDYGQALDEGYYSWEEVYDGYQLVIRDVESLAILGGGREDVRISAEPRYANVLSFRGCANPLVTQLTAGHSQEPGYCAGGVLSFEGCAAPSVLDCALYGCGTLGVNAENCRDLTVRDTDIYECSLGAVWAFGSYDVLLDSCSIYDCGLKGEDGLNCYELFTASACTGFTLLNCDVSGNDTRVLLNTRYAQEVNLLGCRFADNRVSDAVFMLQGAPPVVDGCAFTGNKIAGYYPKEYSGYAVDLEGNDLISFDLDRMERKEAAYDGPTAKPPAAPGGVLAPDGVTTEYHVKTVDDFLAAIGPDSTIYIDAKQLDLSTASSYGGYGSQYYYWETRYDGPSLVIAGVSNLRIVGRGKDKTELLAIPRYADVLRFVNCENVAVEALTAGHTETGDCAGDVLGFEHVTNITLKDCGLFGCGVWGIRADDCRSMEVTDTEIYSCSSGAFILFRCHDVTMTGVDIHNMPSDETAFLSDCENVLFDGKLLGGGSHKL